jgi:hypothetical protein
MSLSNTILSKTTNELPFSLLDLHDFRGLYSGGITDVDSNLNSGWWSLTWPRSHRYLWRKQTMYKILLTLIFALVSLSTQARPLYIWSVQLTGQTLTGTLNSQFQKVGTIYAVVPGFNNDPNSQNGYNPVDVVVSVGDPTGMRTPPSAGYPPTGSFEFSSIGLWFDFLQSPHMDLAYMQFNEYPEYGGLVCLTLWPDSNRVPIGINVINTFSALGATHIIKSGALMLCSKDGWNTMTGRIEVEGVNAIGGSPANYTADVEASLINVVDF